MNPNNSQNADSSPELSAPAGSAKSPADILLWAVDATVPVRIVIEGRADLRIEKRAYVCPLCGQAEQYLMINDNVVKGCGMVSHSGGGISVERCTRWQCVAEANRRVDAAMQNTKFRDAAAPRSL